MTAYDVHTYFLECRACGRKAKAVVSDNDGWAFMRKGPERSIVSLDGAAFRWVDSIHAPKHEGGYFYCECGQRWGEK